MALLQDTTVSLNEILPSFIDLNLIPRLWIPPHWLRGGFYAPGLRINRVTLTTDLQSGLNARIHMPACWDGKVSHTSPLCLNVLHLYTMLIECWLPWPYVTRRVSVRIGQWKVPFDSPGSPHEAILRGKHTRFPDTWTSELTLARSLGMFIRLRLDGTPQLTLGRLSIVSFISLLSDKTLILKLQQLGKSLMLNSFPKYWVFMTAETRRDILGTVISRMDGTPRTLTPLLTVTIRRSHLFLQCVPECHRFVRQPQRPNRNRYHLSMQVPHCHQRRHRESVQDPCCSQWGYQWHAHTASRVCWYYPHLSFWSPDGFLSQSCNPIQAGPGDATIYSTANCPI